MRSDRYWPIIRQSLDYLRENKIAPSDLLHGGQDHHFSGYGLWFRHRFIHAGDDATRRLLAGHPDSVSGFFTRLIANHGFLSDDQWREVLAEELDFEIWEIRPWSLEYVRRASLRACTDKDL